MTNEKLEKLNKNIYTIVNETAVKIAMNHFFSNLETLTDKEINDLYKDLNVENLTVWEPFEHRSADDLLGDLNCLIDSITDGFNQLLNYTAEFPAELISGKTLL